MKTLVNTKLGESRGKKRLWLEGKKLSQANWLSGEFYNIETEGDELKIVMTPHGQYKVSRRERNGVVSPIIDLTVNELAELFEGVEKLRVLIQKGSITVSAHHQEGLVSDRNTRLLNKIKSGEKLDVCSLFHGGGVLDKAIHRGLKNSGINSRLALAVEIESSFLDSSLRNNPEIWDEKSLAIESPIQDVDMNKTTNFSADILIAGIPCTGASKAGRSKNKLEYAESHSEAGAMFFNFLQFVQKLNPSIVIIENVTEYANTASMEVIKSVLNSLGYNINITILDGNEFGTLERRKRMCCIAVSKGLMDINLEDLKPVRSKEDRISDILDQNIPEECWKEFTYLAEKEERDKASGKGFRRQLLNGSEEFCGVIGKDYAKCRSTEPFIVHPTKPELSRLFTVNEHAKLKGIPLETVDGLSNTIAHQILGQSICFPAFEAVGNYIGSIMNGLFSNHLDIAV